jgi:hypothetical protein
MGYKGQALEKHVGLVIAQLGNQTLPRGPSSEETIPYWL